MKVKNIWLRTEISFTSAITFNLFLILLFLFVQNSFADTMPANDSNMYMMDDVGEYGPDDIRITVPSNSVFVEGPAIENVIEAVGRITYSSVPIYNTTDKKSKVLRYALPGEKVIITASNDDWYCVRTYDGKEGFIEKRNLKTAKVFYDENVTTNYMDKRLNFELKALVDRFNEVLSQSIYLEKFQIVPKLTLTNSAKRNNIITLTLEYSAVDKNGMVVPSKQMNNLNKEMQAFVELLFMKMLPSRANSYKIVIRRPVFSAKGQVINTQGEYAEIILKYDDVDVASIKSKEVKILDLVECNKVNAKNLFESYPY